MSNYSQTTFFTPKDSLPAGNPGKTIFGAAYDVEFGNISTAISSKYDVTNAAGVLAYIAQVNAFSKQQTITAAANALTLTTTTGTTSGILIINAFATTDSMITLNGVTSGRTMIQFFTNTTLETTIGTSGGGSQIITGAGVGDFNVTANVANINFSVNNGGGIQLQLVKTSGAVQLNTLSGNYGYTVTPATNTQIPGLQLQTSGGSRALEVLFVGTGASPVYGASAGDCVLNASSQGNAVLRLSTADAARVTIGANGNVTIAAPSSGSPLSITGPSTANVLITLTGGAASSSAFNFVSNLTGTGTGVPTLSSNKPGGNTGVNTWVLVSLNGTQGYMPVWT